MSNNEQNKNKETPITYKVYRSFSEPDYMVDKRFLKLTPIEVVVCLVVFVLLMTVLEITPYGDMVLWRFIPLDPTLYFAGALLMAVIFTIFHQLSPEGNTLQVLKGWLASKNLAPYGSSPDQFWLPVDKRIYLGNAAIRRNRHES